MTFSILARDPHSGALGGAVATGNLAVGSRVLNAREGVGIVATQGYAGSTLWADALLDELAAQHRSSNTQDRQTPFHPDQSLQRIIKDDTGKALRQITVLDQQGCCAAYSGPDNTPVMDQLLQDNVVVAGNWLISEGVLTTLLSTYLASDQPFALRLLHALQAAARLGGDSRGVMSAALKVVSRSMPRTDLRIDYSSSPVEDLIALHERTYDSEYQQFLSRLPTHESPYQS